MKDEMTKEQMFDMKHTLMIQFESTVTLSNLFSFDNKGHGNVTVVDSDKHFFCYGLIHEGEHAHTQYADRKHNNLGLDWLCFLSGPSLFLPACD